MAKETENKATEKAQEQVKNTKRYKITCGGFKARNEALRKAAEAKKKEFAPAVIVEGGKYNLLYAEGTTKEAAENALKAIKAAGLDAEISESK
jgi:cell division protein FtsN